MKKKTMLKSHSSSSTGKVVKSDSRILLRGRAENYKVSREFTSSVFGAGDKGSRRYLARGVLGRIQCHVDGG
jgi:hypothetical protein